MVFGDIVTEEGRQNIYLYLRFKTGGTDMTTNVGTIDRTLRALLGIVLLGAAFFSGLPLFEAPLIKYLAAAVGVVMLVVAATRVCPVYTVLGLKTCRA